MIDHKIKTQVVHSQSKHAWNVVGTSLGLKYKICRVPYHYVDEEGYNNLNERNKQEALDHANFIAYCFNHSEYISKIFALED
jgi:hypothetical protein